jgi:HK97 gp10 family phage protein
LGAGILMADDDEVQSYLSGLSFKLRRELATKIKEEADGLADAIKAEAPVLSGALRDSVKVRRKRNDLELEVTAGGDTTTKEIRTGSGEPYDYALAVEYGTAGRPAEPFFFNTARQRMPEIQENIQQAVEDVLAKA